MCIVVTLREVSGKAQKMRETQASVNKTNGKTKKHNRLTPPATAGTWYGPIRLWALFKHSDASEAILAQQELQQLVTSLTFLPSSSVLSD